MALIRWTPLREIDELQKEMNRFFNTLAPATRMDGEQEIFSFVPAAELTETPESLHLKLEVPGLEAKDLDVEVMADEVRISGERKSQNQTEENGITRTEFRYGKFHRVIPLTIRIDNTNVTAEYKDGILTLTLPKAEAEKNKVVKVNLG